MHELTDVQDVSFQTLIMIKTGMLPFCSDSKASGWTFWVLLIYIACNRNHAVVLLPQVTCYLISPPKVEHDSLRNPICESVFHALRSTETLKQGVPC